MNRTTGYTSSSRYKCLEDLQRDSEELCLSYCGWEQCEPGHRFGPNQRKAFVLHFVGKGKGTLEINGRQYHIQQGEVFLIPPNVEAWYEADQKDPWFYSWIGFTGQRAKECMDRSGLTLKNPVRQVSCIQEIQGLVEKILEEYQLSYKCELRRDAYVMLIFSHLVEEYQNESPSVAHAYPGSVYAQYAMEYINSHYSEKIKIAELASYIGINRSYLTSSFKKATGYSPQEYLIRLRMDKAASMLKKTNMSVSNIAAAVGYGDQLAFSKIFKQYYGESPRSFRENKDKLVMCNQKGEFKRNDIF